MRRLLLRLATSAEFAPRRNNAILLLILLAVSLCSVIRAIVKPFWYDEICTVILCRLPNASAIWKALDSAADTNPPIYYFVARLTRQFILDDHLGYRLPSILGLLLTVLCLYVILSRVDRLSALVGAAFVLSTPAADYASEARPYALMLGCVSVAVLAWQRIDISRWYSLAVAIALAAAVSLHYYASLVWPAFILAEASIWLFDRRFRVGAWAALFLGALPLLFLSNLLLSLRQYYGRNFWARPSITLMLSAHDWLFSFGGHWGLTFVAGVTVMFIWSLSNTVAQGPGYRKLEDGSFSIGEHILTLMFLWLPVIAVAAAIVSRGGMSSRYMMPTILGGALAVGYLTSKVPGAVRVLLLILMLMNYGLSSANDLKRVLKGTLLEPRSAAAREVKAILTQHHESDLPIVISDGNQYLPLAYYTPADSSDRLFALADPRAAVVFAGSDSVDLGLLVLRRYFPLQVQAYDGFATRHREFLLVSESGRGWDWWPARLSHDGHTLRLLSQLGTTRVYRVTLKP